jgi:hypothetical protein
MYAIEFRMSNLEFLLGGEVFQVRGLAAVWLKAAGGAARSPLGRFRRGFPDVPVGS